MSSRLPLLSPERYRRLALGTAAAVSVVVVTGAVVRLTASGLGCDHWPRCGDTPFPEQEFHALVEFGNRVVAFLALICTAVTALVARRVPGLPAFGRRAAALTALAVLAQIPLGGLTVIFHLQPLLVISHFLLALVAVGTAVIAALGAHLHARGLPDVLVPRLLTASSLALVPLALALVVTGAFVTAAGPHSGGADIERLGVLARSLQLHIGVATAFGVCFALLLLALAQLRSSAQLELSVAGGVLLVLIAQMAVGRVQWEHALPWGLVLAHVALATLVWIGVVLLAALLGLRTVRVDSLHGRG